MCKRVFVCVFFALSFVAGFLSYSHIYRPVSGISDDFNETHELDNQYKFINPLLQCDQGEMLQHNTSNFKPAVQNYVDSTKQQGKVSDIAVYYRNLNNGPWFGIDEREEFLPSSMLKVPLLISFLQLVEERSKFSEETIEFSGSDIKYDLNFPPKERIQVGSQYTLRELAERMIIYSDNDAALLLSKKIGPDHTIEVYKDLGFQVRNDDVDFMSAKDYSSFFRILYNASYLEKPFSDAALSLLSQTDFKDGLVRGVPSDVLVAHKFGEHIVEGENLKQLHDCGIVYFPKDPYLLCVMTRGSSFDSLLEVISEVSRIVYTEVEKQNK